MRQRHVFASLLLVVTNSKKQRAKAAILMFFGSLVTANKAIPTADKQNNVALLFTPYCFWLRPKAINQKQRQCFLMFFGSLVRTKKPKNMTTRLLLYLWQKQRSKKGAKSQCQRNKQKNANKLPKCQTASPKNASQNNYPPPLWLFATMIEIIGNH